MGQPVCGRSCSLLKAALRERVGMGVGAVAGKQRKQIIGRFWQCPSFPSAPMKRFIFSHCWKLDTPSLLDNQWFVTNVGNDTTYKLNTTSVMSLPRSELQWLPITCGVSCPSCLIESAFSCIWACLFIFRRQVCSTEPFPLLSGHIAFLSLSVVILPLAVPSHWPCFPSHPPPSLCYSTLTWIGYASQPCLFTVTNLFVGRG